MRSIGLILLLSGFSVLAQGVDNQAIAQVAGPAIVAQKPDEIDRDIYEVLNEGIRLLQEGRKESLAASIRQFDTALKLSWVQGDRSKQAMALVFLGRVYNELGEQAKALDYYNQVLPLVRAIGERSGEATTLNNIGLIYNELGEKAKALVVCGVNALATKVAATQTKPSDLG